jgi:hypothetical protein
MTDEAIRSALVRHWAFEGKDYDRSHEIYHDDAILEFPQSGERFVGKDAFLTWRRKYPAEIRFRLRRISHAGDLWVTENLISYDGSPWMFTTNLLRFRGERIAHEALYVFEGFPPAEFRAEFSTSFDPLASIDPAEWGAGASFGLSPITDEA